MNKEKTLSEMLRYWKTENPGERLMAQFILMAQDLETQLADIRNGLVQERECLSKMNDAELLEHIRGNINGGARE